MLSEPRFRAMLDTAPVLMWISGTDKLCTYFNKPWLDFTGRSLEEELGNGWAKGVHAEDQQKCLEAYAESFDRRETFRMDYRLRRHDGKYRWIRDIGVPRFNRDGSFAGYMGIGIDVSDRELAEQNLTRATERLRLALEAGKAGGWEWEIKSGRNLWFGKSHELVGIPAEQYSSSIQEFWDRVHPEDRVWLQDAEREAIQNHREFAPEFRVVWQDGTVHWLRSQAQFFYGADGQAERMLGICVEITEQKRAQEALRESEERFRLAAQAGKMFAYSWDATTDVLECSPEFARILGVDREAVATGAAVSAMVHPDDKRTLGAAIAKLTPERPNLQITYRLIRPDGVIIWLERNSRAYFDGQGKIQCLVGMVVDITERKWAEEALRESEERLRLAAQAGRMFAYKWDVRTDEVRKSPEYNNILGLRTEPERTTRQEFFNRVHPADRPRLVANLGEPTPENPHTQISFRVLRPDGAVVWLEKSGRAFFDASGKMVSMIGMVVDITERKLAEEALSSISQKLIEAQEQERARIARELHDDIGQRLALLAMGCDQIEQIAPSLPAEVLNRIRELQKQSKALSADVQTMSRALHPPKLEYLGLVAAMSNICSEFGDHQRVEIDFRSHDVSAPLPPEISLCLIRVLQEALQNAAKHSGVRHMEVELRGTPDEIQLSVRDLGKGFDLNAAMQGRGLGLTSMHERVRLLNGTVLIQSKPMGGTTVEVRVPVRFRADSQCAAG